MLRESPTLTVDAMQILEMLTQQGSVRDPPNFLKALLAHDQSRLLRIEAQDQSQNDRV